MKGTDGRVSFTIGVSHKMYFSHARTLEWCSAVADLCREHPATRDGLVDFFVLPTFLSLPAVLASEPPYRVGAQDVATADSGPYTGEVSGAEIAELGGSLAEVGHAERRRLFGETSEMVAAKTAAALRNGLDVVLCLGEPVRTESTAAAALCVAQIESALSQARSEGLSGRVIAAYEPEWAIGAAEPAPIEHIADVCADLKAMAADDDRFQVDVIYGGSAGPGLLSEIHPAADGLFLGRFAHDPDAVRSILDEALALTDRSLGR